MKPITPTDACQRALTLELALMDEGMLICQNVVEAITQNRPDFTDEDLARGADIFRNTVPLSIESEWLLALPDIDIIEVVVGFNDDIRTAIIVEDGSDDFIHG